MPHFLQAAETVTHEICSRAVDRLLRENIDFNVVLRDKTGDFIDTTFDYPHAIYWDDMRPSNPQDDESGKDLYWERISDIFDSDQYSMWGSNGIEFTDPNQGAIGDCWIIAAASCVAQEPERIKKLFLIDHLNDAGVYAVQLYVMGIPVTVTVDEYLPFYYPDDDYMIYGRKSNDGALWMPILEKAAAKLFGNYEMLSGGWMGPAIQTLTGSPFFEVFHSQMNVEELWEWLDTKVQSGWMVTAGTPLGTGTDKDQNELGVAYMHAYTMLDTLTLSNGQRLIKMRNPWGSETYNGPWGDDSAKWTAQLKEEAGHVDNDDGMWYITPEDFHRSFSDSCANPEIGEYQQTYFAAFDVDTTSETHVEELTIKSDVDQTVYISAYTYDSQMIRNGACYDGTNDTKLWLTHERASRWWSLKYYGYAHADAVEMSAGESFDITFEALWGSQDLSPHDFSIVVWAEKQAVTLTSIHKEHLSEQFPIYTLASDVTIYGLDGQPISTDVEPQPVEPVEDPDEILGLPSEMTGAEPVFTHEFQYNLEGSTVKTSYSAVDDSNLQLKVTMTDSASVSDLQSNLRFVSASDLTFTLPCGTDFPLYWGKTTSDEISNDRQRCSDGSYWAEFKTNFNEPKQDDWFNSGDMMAVFEFDSGVTYTLGINLDATSVAGKLSKGDKLLGVNEWIWINSAFGAIERNDADGEDTNGVIVHENSVPWTLYVQDLTLKVDGTTTVKELVRVVDAWSLVQTLMIDSDDWLTILLTYTGEKWTQEVMWNGVTGDTFELPGSSAANVSTQQQSIASNGSFQLDQSTTVSTGDWSVTVKKANGSIAWKQQVNLLTGLWSQSLEIDSVERWADSFSLAETDWDPSSSQEGPIPIDWNVDDDISGSSSAGAIVGGILGVVIAIVTCGYFCKSKNGSETDNDYKEI